MAIGRISGSVLKANLTRNGTDLAFETNLLYLDVTNSRIGIGTSSPSTTLDVNGTVNATSVTGLTSLGIAGTGTSALLTLTTTEASASASPIIALKRNSSSPADSDSLGQIQFLGENDADEEVEYGRITTTIFDASNGTEDGKMQVKLMEAGTLTNAVRFESNTLFLNTGNTITFEGATADNYETILTVEDPTGDHTVSLPNADGTLIPGKIGGTDFTNSLLVGHATTGTLDECFRNVGVGPTALDALTRGDDNTAVGYGAGSAITTGQFNTPMGNEALYQVSTGLRNSALGYQSLYAVTGNNNTGLGQGSGFNLTSGSGNIIIGVVNADSATDSRQLKIAGYDGSSTTTWIKGVSSGAITFNSAYTFPTADGDADQVLQTDGSGTITFADIEAEGGGNNTAVKQFNYYKLGTTSAVIDEFDLDEFRGAVYNVTMEDHDNSLIGHAKVSVVHNDSTPYISVYDLNEDSTNIVNFTAAISGDMLQLSGSTQSSTHTNLRIYRIALGDHHETVSGTNSKIIKASTAITTAGVTLDQFTKTDIQGAKYVVLFKDSTQTEYQISEVSLTHNGTTVFFNDYAKVSTRSDYAFTLSSTISSSTLTLTAASTGGTTATAILYRQDLGSKTKLGEFDNTLYGKKSDIDSTVETIDSFDVFKYKTASYFINIGHSGDTAYQNSEITLTVNSAGSGATISESVVRTGTSDLATFTADVSGGKARLRMQGTSANNVIYFARLGMEAKNIYRANAQTSDDLYIKHSNIIGPSTLDSKTIMVGKSEGTNFTGSLLLGHNTTGTLNAATYNTGVGLTALDALTSADYNTAVGYGAMGAQATGANNVAIGSSAMLVSANGQYNVALGHNTMLAATSGNLNVAIGENSLLRATAPSANVGVGQGTLINVSDGAGNIGLGRGAGNNITSGDGNVVIGYADVSSATGDDQLSISDGNDGSVVWITGDSSGHLTFSNDLILDSDSCVLKFGDDQEITITHVADTGILLQDSGGTPTLQLHDSNESIASDGSKIIITSGGTAFNFPTSDGSANQVLETDGSGTLSFTSVSTSSTTDLADTWSGGKTSIGTSATNVDTFTTSAYDSTFYLAVTRDEINEEIATDQISVVHNNTTAFVASGGGVRSGDNDHITYTADINSGSVRLRGTGTSAVNSIKFFRIAMGDNTSATSSGATAISLNSDVDSAVENIDTWAHASYRGAKYYISANNSSKTELQNIECSVVHNGTTAFIATYNNVYTGNNALIALTADISGSDVRLRATGNEPNTAVKMFRILLGDSESDLTGTNTKVVGAVTVSSSATAIDTFSSDSYTGAHYVVVGYNSGESGTPGSVSEVFVVHDGTTAYVSSGPIVSSKGTDQLTFTAALEGTTVTLNALSTSGGSTTVNAFRTHIQRSAIGVSIVDAQTISGAKTFTASTSLAGGTMTGDLDFGDDVDANFGASDDLKIYHNGNNSFISDQGTGGLYVLTNDFRIRNAANNEDILRASQDGDVELYYNDALKFTTTGFGVTIGGATAMGVTSDPSTLADHAHIYAKDDTASAEVYVRDEAGNVTKLSPHNEKGEWEYFSRNVNTGKVVRVNMEEMVRDIEKLTGKTYIKEE